ncbi:putative alpha-acetolactate decarboxylase precursor [Xylogone sp. PMI_703]|nr:putative alpha-acetolactate decarboxylase precursor [Xylogone sp. PMI_703]
MAPLSQLYQYSTASALMAGIASTGIKLSELLSHGNVGLGTMINIQGEVVLIDGKAYHLQSSGEVVVAEEDRELPFAMVTRLDDADSGTVIGLTTKQSIYDQLILRYPGVTNRFVVFVIEGAFDRMKVRVVRGQQYAGQPLSELGDQQKVISHQDVKGRVVGFWSPQFMDGVSVYGLHAHFLSSDTTFGGHVLELEAGSSLKLTSKLINSFSLQLPEDTAFDTASLQPGGEALQKVEG